VFSVSIDRTGLRIACLVLAALALSGAPADAQGFFGLFENNRGGGWFGQRQRTYVPQQASPYADPSQNGSDRYGSSFGTHSYGERPASTPSSGGGRGVA
jgi:hypothetical protein